jgi:dTDP-4-amino-4,6-dideoxygalactose transaminase
VRRVPFNRPFTTGRETELMLDAVQRGHLSGDGEYTRRASALLRDLTGADDVLLTTSCTHALEMTAMLLDLAPGDEVIMPSFTFVSTANAFALRGARPVFVDIKSGTNNLDEKLIEQAITERTKAIVVVHYAGVGCEMGEIMSLATSRGIAVIEDNAHGLGGTYRSQRLGSFGALSTLSFHETKNVHCGEGGALVINDPTLLERAEIIREKGTNRSRFFRGQVDKYTWVDLGSSYLPSDLLAAFLTAQLEEFDNIQAQRMSIWQHYAAELASWAHDQSFELPDPPPHTEHPAHMFWMLAPDLETRQRFIKSLDAADVQAVFHYVPLHASPAGRRLSGEGSLTVTENVSDRLVRLPLFAGLGADELARVVDAVLAFRSE